MEIRNAHREDLEEIVAIYNQAVKAGFQTADIEPWQAEDKQVWFNQHLQPGHPIFVAVEEGAVIGYLVISAYRPGRGALAFTKEVSCYIHQSHIRKGVGMQLLQHAINNARSYAAKHLVAIVLEANTASISLLQKAGFALWGHLPNVAEFNGITCGHVYYGLQV